MSLRIRLKSLETKMRMRVERSVLIISDGQREEWWRTRALAARKRGQRLTVVRLTVMSVADTLQEAEEAVRAHKARWPKVPLTVYHRRAPRKEVLATWEPGLPEWLRGEGEAHGE